MKKRSETEACVLAVLYVIGFGISCYMHSFVMFLTATLYVCTLLACSWRIERLERRIKYYRHELDRQIRDEIEAEIETETETKITMTKGA